MTLQEHLEEIGRTLASNGAKRTESLLFQLYLVCTAKEGYLGEDAKQAQYEDPFDQVYPLLKDTWSKVDFDVLGAFYDDEELEFLGAEIYESVFFELLNRAARDGGSEFAHLQPKELTSIVTKLCGETEGKSIYNPYAGVGSYAEVFRAGDRYYGEELDKPTWAIGVLKAWMEGNSSRNYVCGDSLSPDWENRFDIVVSTPPLGLIPDGPETFCERLVKNARELLTPGGILVMVTTLDSLIGPRKKVLLDTGMLDMVISLPRDVFYWSGIAPFIVCLRNGRNPDDPVTLVDGVSFSSPGGRRTRIINEEDLLHAIADRDPDVMVSHTPEELRNSSYGLNPPLYIPDKEVIREDGAKMVSLRTLGYFLKLPRYVVNDSNLPVKPEFAITVEELTSGPALVDVKPRPLEKEIRGFSVLSQSALLVYAFNNKIRIGYAHATSDNPVYIQSRIHAFVPEEKLISVGYLALALTKADVASRASAVFVTRDDLLLTLIPLVSKEKQQAIIQKELESLHDAVVREAPSSRNTKKTGVVFIGSQPSTADVFKKSLKIQKTFGDPSDAKNWLENNKQKVDAVIVSYLADMNPFDIYDLCKNDIPVYFLTASMKSFERLVGMEQYLKDHSFVFGSESDLVEELIQEVAERKTPEWLIRQRYARELEAAESIDNRFPPKDYSTRSVIEDMLISEEARTDWRNQLRTIRTDCVLKPLVDYGFLPSVQSGSFNLGAQIDLLADRIYSPNSQQFRHVLIREVVPTDIADLLQGSKRLLNEGSHTIKIVDRDLQMATLFSIMAALCHIAKMIDEGLFDRCEPERISTIYQATFRDDEYETGVQTVICRHRPDHTNYYYAGNIHLNDARCKSLRIKQGDQVEIFSAGKENTPIITDSVCILFHSNDFIKVP